MVRLEDNSLLIIPSGFVTNFGSIPKPVRCFLNRMGKSLRAFVVHDWLYSVIPSNYLKLPQRECDEILYTLGRYDGESWFKAHAINKGLVIGGWCCYKKTKPIIKPVSETTLKYIANSNRYNIERKGIW